MNVGGRCDNYVFRVENIGKLNIIKSDSFLIYNVTLTEYNRRESCNGTVTIIKADAQIKKRKCQTVSPTH